jgi:BON domain
MVEERASRRGPADELEPWRIRIHSTIRGSGGKSLIFKVCEAPHHQKLSTKEVEEKLRKGFDSKNAAYSGSNIQAAVDDQSVTLTGTVNRQKQHEMALQLTRAYADERKITDHWVVQQ